MNSPCISDVFTGDSFLDFKFLYYFGLKKIGAENGTICLLLNLI